MAYRTAGVFKVGTTNTPQPLFGSWITAVVTGVLTPAPQLSPVTVTLGTAQNAGNDASQIFVPGEEVWLIDPGGLNGETSRVLSISGNNLTLGPSTRVDPQGRTSIVLANPHVAGALGTGTYIIPKQMMNNFLVQFEDGATGTFLYLGNSPTMTAVLKRFFKLAKVAAGVQPQFYSAAMFSPGNPFDLSELFVYGTSGDMWDVSINVD